MRCRVCKCTDERACDPPCSWHSRGLCSTCASAVAAMLSWQEDSLRPSLAALTAEFKDARDNALRVGRGKYV